MAAKAARSSPAQNDGPAPESTTARTAESPASASAVSIRASSIARSMALRFSGRFRRTSATPSRIVAWTRSDMGK